jgi:amino acid transporter
MAILISILFILLPLTGSVVACVATASRQAWAFARDNGVPFSATARHVSIRSLSHGNSADTTAQINPKSAIPLNAIIISLVVCVLLSLINIGSTAALNAILALDLTALLASYIVSIGCLLLKRLRSEPVPHREWSLGKAGTAINIAALCWLFPVLIFTLFPSSVPVTPDGMNWECLLFGFMVLFASGYYVVKGRHMYVSPRERLRRGLEGEVSMAV